MPKIPENGQAGNAAYETIYLVIRHRERFGKLEVSKFEGYPSYR